MGVVLWKPRRIKTEAKAKVVAFILGEEFIQFLASLAFLPRTIMNGGMNCTRMICKKRMNTIHPIDQNRPRQNSYSETRNLINSVPQTEATTLAFSPVFILLLWAEA